MENARNEYLGHAVGSFRYYYSTDGRFYEETSDEEILIEEKLEDHFTDFPETGDYWKKIVDYSVVLPTDNGFAVNVKTQAMIDGKDKRAYVALGLYPNDPWDLDAYTAEEVKEEISDYFIGYATDAFLDLPDDVMQKILGYLIVNYDYAGYCENVELYLLCTNAGTDLVAKRGAYYYNTAYRYRIDVDSIREQAEIPMMSREEYFAECGGDPREYLHYAAKEIAKKKDDLSIDWDWDNPLTEEQVNEDAEELILIG